MNDPVRQARSRASRLRELTAVGYTDAEIGDILGAHRRTVRTWRCAAGILPGLVQVPAAFPHGTPTGYRRGCRDDCCKTPTLVAQRALRGLRQRDTMRTAVHALDPWTPADDAVVMTLPVLAAAYALGRTYLGVDARRTVLRDRSKTQRRTTE